MEPPSSFRNDLYALHAMALLLILAQYGSLPFFESGWPIQDEQRSLWYVIPYILGNGFLPQAFFITSGFFIARLWRKLGLAATLRNRVYYLLLPFLLASAAIVPLSTSLFMQATESLAYQDIAKKPICETPAANIWCAARNGDVQEIGKYLAAGVDIDTPDMRNGLTPLTWATQAGKFKVASYLLKMGADIDGKNSDGGTALHEAATMGQDGAAEFLIKRGANIVATDSGGETPLYRVHSGWKYLHTNMKDRQLVSDLRRSHWGWTNVARLLIKHGATDKIVDMSTDIDEHTTADDFENAGVWHTLTKQELLQHIGFLWVACLLIPFFALYAVVVNRWKWAGMIKKLVLSRYRYLWLIPLTMIPQWFMAGQGAIAGFGPDHAASIVQPLHMLCYYGIFFFFGVMYYDCNDSGSSLGKHWRLSLLLALLVVFPIGMTISILRFVYTVPWFGLHLSKAQYLLAVAVQVIFTWMMVVGMLGFFRYKLTERSKVWGYLSDNSYWLFLFHPPLLLYIQNMIRKWSLPSDAKYIMTLVTVLGVMLLTYEVIARYTPIAKIRDGYRQLQ